MGIPPDARSLLRLPPLLDGGTGPLWGCAPVKTRGQLEQRPGISRDTQLRAAPGSADRLAAASSPLLRERVPDELLSVQDVHDAYAVASVEQHHAPREPEGPWPTSSPARASCWLAAAEQQVVSRRTSRSPTASSVSSSLASWGSVVAFATTECHLGVDGRRARALPVHQKVRTPYRNIDRMTPYQLRQPPRRS